MVVYAPSDTLLTALLKGLGLCTHAGRSTILSMYSLHAIAEWIQGQGYGIRLIGDQADRTKLYASGMALAADMSNQTARLAKVRFGTESESHSEVETA